MILHNIKNKESIFYGIQEHYQKFTKYVLHPRMLHLFHTNMTPGMSGSPMCYESDPNSKSDLKEVVGINSQGFIADTSVNECNACIPVYECLPLLK